MNCGRTIGPGPVLALLATLAGSAQAEPSAPNHTVPACITLVTAPGSGIPEVGLGAFEVIIRDLANNPIPNVHVTVDISNAPELHLCADQQDPAATLECAAGRVTKLTGSDGRVQFTLLGGSDGAGNAVTLQGGGRIYVQGQLIGTPTVSAVDLDGQQGLGANDLSAFFTDFASGNPYGRSDYDCNGTIGANDFSLWLQVFASGTGAASCGGTCP